LKTRIVIKYYRKVGREEGEKIGKRKQERGNRVEPQKRK